MTTYDFLVEFLKVYFWVFIVVSVIQILSMFTDNYQESKRNSIKNGTYNQSLFGGTIAITLFILSIILTK